MSLLFHRISGAMSAANVPFLLIGGFAVTAYGSSRNTKDVDVMIYEADYSRAFAELHRLGYDEFYKSELFSKLKAARVQGPDIDVMFVDRATFDAVNDHAREISVYGVPFRVPQPEDIIAMKLHACVQGGFRREMKDLIDIVTIIETQGLDAQSPEFRTLCLKFGNAKLFDDILKALRQK
ncbi:MAG: nucleotidyl transferase AbiEii/AbiGii toxin family protein [bacterium]